MLISLYLLSQTEMLNMILSHKKNLYLYFNIETNYLK